MTDYIKKLKQIRTEKKLSLQKIAEKLGVTEEFVSMIEIGEILPSQEQMDTIVEFVIEEMN